MKSNGAKVISPIIKNRDIAMWLIVLGVLSGALALSLMLARPKATTPSQASLPTPDSTKPAPEVVAAYSVAPENPKYIEAPSIQLSQTRIIPLGVAKDYRIIPPANLHDAGWYKDTAKPGQKGAAFIYGHLSSLQANGAFHNLSRLKKGDIIKITRGDDKVYSYEVRTTQTYATNDVPMDRVLAPIASDKPGLNLMTCAGQVDQSSGEFSERFVAYAVLVSS